MTFQSCLDLSSFAEIPMKFSVIVTPDATPDNDLIVFVRLQVEVQCEQLSRELVRHREQLEREAQALQGRLAEAREEGRAEARKHKEELAQSVNHTHFIENYNMEHSCSRSSLCL